MNKQYQSSSGTIFYRVKGIGPAIVLLHGFLEDHSIWNEFSDHLQHQFTCISIDLPGFGKSDVFDTLHTMEFMAEKVNDIIEQEQVNECAMVGHSMGGYVSLAFAKLFPQKLKGLVLFHSHAAADSDENKKIRDRTIKVVQQNHSGFINTFIPSLFAEENIAKFANEIGILREIAEKTSEMGIIAALKGMRDREDHREMLKNFLVPVYFIIGKQDAKIPMEVIVPQLKLPANCEALIMDDVGHMGFIEARERTLMVIDHFAERYLL